MISKASIVIGISVLLVTAWGCQKEAPKKETAAAAAKTNDPAQKSGDKAAVKAPPKLGKAAAAVKTPAKPEKTVYHAGAHILIAYKGAQRAKPTVTRSKEDALKEAKRLADLARKDPSKFEELAKKHSDGPSGPQGGSLGIWPKGRMVPAFDKAIEGMKVDEVSEPVETPFGYHVIVRRVVPPAMELTANQILIAFKGGMRAKPTITRSKEDAKKKAEKLAKELKAKPETFEAVAKKESDGPRADKGGPLGTWHTLRSRMPPLFTRVVRGLKEGEVSDVAESPWGFHVFMRVPEPPKFSGSHILLAYKGAMRANKSVTRTKPEAKKLAEKLLAELKAAPAKFVEYAAKHSNGPSAAKGGSLGTWQKGRMVPEFDAAVQKMKVGEMTGPVETKFGFHIIRRDAVTEEK